MNGVILINRECDMVLVEHCDFVINMDSIASFYPWYKDIRFLYKNEATADTDFSMCLTFDTEQKAKWAFDEILDAVEDCSRSHHIVVRV